MDRRSEHEDECESECTCTGGPYIHGPLGRALILAEARAKKPTTEKDGKK